MHRKVIANTTPLIALADIGHLDLLQKLYGEIMIPRAVLDEIKSEPAKSIVRAALKTAVKMTAENNSVTWINVCSISDVNAKRLYRAKLHAGEVEVMILAEEQNADLVLMDDNAAKKTAKFMGLKVTGTLGVLLRAKREGHIKEVQPLMKRLIETGMFISENICRYVLKEAGEE